MDSRNAYFKLKNLKRLHLFCTKYCQTITNSMIYRTKGRNRQDNSIISESPKQTTKCVPTFCVPILTDLNAFL